MSEIRETTSIHSVSYQQAREPLFTIADVFAGLWGATSLAVKGVVATAHVVREECRVAKAAGNAQAAAQLRPVATDRVASDIATAGSVQDAVKILAAIPLFVSKDNLECMRAKTLELSQKGGAATVAQVSQLAREFAREHQQVLVTNSIAIVKEACLELGFDRLKVRPENGYLLAQRSSAVGGPSLRMDIKAGVNGGIELHVDADKFNGMTCHNLLDRLETTLRKKGLQFDSMNVQSKQGRPVLDAVRAPLGTRIAFPHR